MASTPDCRVSSASLPQSAGCSGLPAPTDFAFPALTVDALLQRQLDELRAIHRQLQRLDDVLQPARDPAFPHPAIRGDFLVFPELWRFQHELSGLTRQCGALAQATQSRLDRIRRGVQRLNAAYLAAHLAVPSQEHAHGPY